MRCADGEPARELERRVYLESEGLPLFVAEYLAALRAGEGAEESLPGEVRSLLGARLGNLSEVAHQVLGAAAVVGRSFELDTVREVSGRSDEEAVTALEELVAQGVVRELTGAEPAYDFWHEKLRALVYEQMTQSRRRLLHARVAATLGKGRPRDESAALIASHLHLAGDQAGAAQQHYRAAQHAASLHAYIDALEHLEAALALGYPDPARLLEWVGDLRTLVGNYGGALAAYESAAAQGGPDRLAIIEHRVGDVHQRRGEWERAEAHFAQRARSGSCVRGRPAGAHHRGLGAGRAPHRPAASEQRPSRAKHWRWPRRRATVTLRPRHTTCSACSPAARGSSTPPRRSWTAAWPWRGSWPTSRRRRPRSTTGRSSIATRASWTRR